MSEAAASSFLETRNLLTEALALLGAAPSATAARLEAAAARVLSGKWRVLVSGLCSVGKSSFVGALWGDSQMLPTAVRDCTQTNTLIRMPAPGEEGRRILLSYLPREQAIDFAARDLSYYRLVEFLSDARASVAAVLEEKLPAERLQTAVGSVRKLFSERPDLHVLHEPLTEELEKLEQFLQFIGSAQYRPGETIAARWDDRRELLMGHRRPDGRTLDVGKLLSLRHVEMVRQSEHWATCASVPGYAPPELIDTPWIPTYHNARRADLILAQAREADILVLLALPDRYQLEPWVLQIFKERPELLRRTLVVFNQIDTVDAAALFTRDGFATAFQENSDVLRKLGIPRENLYLACARLPFLENSPPDDLAQTLSERLRRVLERLRKISAERPESDFTRRLRQASDPADAGVETVRARLLELGRTLVLRAHATDALQRLREIPAIAVPPAAQTQWKALAERAAALLQQFA